MSDAERIPTNLRTLLILEILGRSEGPMTATEINAELGLPKQTVHRLCTTLEREGFISQVHGTRRFQPSRRARELGSGLLHSARTHIARRQILMMVAQEVRETVNFVVPEPGGMSYLDRVETDWAFQIKLPIGSNVPFHCTASGKCFLASLPDRARRAFVEALTLDTLTEKTLTNPATLLEELSDVRRLGHAMDREEFMDGMVALAVPVHDAEGRYVASLATHGPSQRLSLETAVNLLPVMEDGARKLSDVLFSDA